jgi:hypothetical protein
MEEEETATREVEEEEKEDATTTYLEWHLSFVPREEVVEPTQQPPQPAPPPAVTPTPVLSRPSRIPKPSVPSPCQAVSIRRSTRINKGQKKAWE